MSQSKKKPAYQEVADKLEEMIRTGVYTVGTKIPTESQLEETFQVSRTTIRAAISILTAKKILRVQQGYGTEVISSGMFQRYNQFSVVKEIADVPLETMRLKNMHLDRVRVPDDDAALLELPAGSMVYRIQRLFTIEEMPFRIMTNYIPEKIAPNLLEHEGEFRSIYPYLRKQYDVVYLSSEDEVSAVPASFMQAQVLRIETGAPLLYTRRISLSNKGIMECAHYYTRADIYRLKISVQEISDPDDSFSY